MVRLCHFTHSATRPSGLLSLLLSLLLAASAVATSCTRTVQPGGAIRFRALSRSSSPATKTSYSGVVTGGVERLDWLSGEDAITIACAQCLGATSANYIVSGTVTPSGATSSADLLTPSDGNGLQWGTTNPHVFYGVYPAGVASVTTAGVVSATFPASQGGTGLGTSSSTSAGITTTRVAPEMDNAFLYCSKSSAPSSDVSLDFSPLFTAFQFTVGGDDTVGDVGITSAELSSTSCTLSGSFNYDIAGSTYTIPVRVAGTNDRITYTFPTGTVVNTTKQIQFIIFVQPSSSVTGDANLNGTAGVITDLTIRFTLSDTNTRALALKYDSGSYGGNYVDFPGGHKINISGLTVPTQLKEWSFTVESIADLDATLADVVAGNATVSDLTADGTEHWVYEVQ